MRIRSIKPEFWRSDAVNSMSIEDRLLFIGLWSYVDDNGVGVDRVSDVCADLFAHDLSVSPHGVLTQVAGGLNRLHALGVIERYSVGGKKFLEVSNWSEHQRINRPSPGRYPRSDDAGAEIHAPLTESSVSPHADVVPGAGEQGSRGAGESLPPALRTEPHQRANASARASRSEIRMRELNATARSAEADRFASSFSQWAGGGIPSQMLIEIAQEVDQLLGDRIDPVQIADGIKAWHASDRIYPSQIPGFVAKAARPADTPKPTKATLRAVSTLDDAEALIAQFQAGTA